MNPLFGILSAIVLALAAPFGLLVAFPDAPDAAPPASSPPDAAPHARPEADADAADAAARGTLRLLLNNTGGRALVVVTLWDEDGLLLAQRVHDLPPGVATVEHRVPAGKVQTQVQTLLAAGSGTAEPSGCVSGAAAQEFAFAAGPTTWSMRVGRAACLDG